MDIQKINQIFADTAYIRTGGSAEELKCAEYLAKFCTEFGGKAQIVPFPVQMAKIKNAHLYADGEVVEATLALLENSPDRVVTRSVFDGKRLSGEAIAAGEYDVSLKYELFLKKGTLDSLMLEMPFRAERAACLHALGVMRGTDTVRLPEKDGVVWDAKHLKTLVLQNFANYVFIGDAFQCAAGGRTDANHASTCFFCRINCFCRFFGNLIILRMHMMI